MIKNKILKLSLTSILLISLLFLFGLLYYGFEYYRSYSIPRDEVRDYKIRLLENDKKILQFKNYSPHSMIQFQGANATDDNGITYLKLKYCSKQNLFCKLKYNDVDYNHETQLHSLRLPNNSNQIHLDFGKEGTVKVDLSTP